MTIVIVLSVWTVDSQGLLRFADDCLSDIANAFTAQSYAPSQVLLVYAPLEVLDDGSKLTALAERISEDQPAKIAIVHPIRADQKALISQQPFASDVIVGYQRDADVGVASDFDLSHGYLDLCLDGQAVYRNHSFKHQSLAGSQGSGQNRLSIEAAIAKQMLSPDVVQAIPSRPVGVRFYGGASGLPNVTSDDVLADGVIPEMVRDRIVMIGPETTNELGFVTPATRGARRMSRLELHANFLQTLLHNNYLICLSDLGIIGVIFCVPLVCVHSFRNLPNRWMIRAGCALFVFVAALCWVSLSVWSVRMPVTAMLASVALSFVSVLYLRFQALKELVENWRTLRLSNNPIKLRQAEGDRWDAMADSVMEVFSPQRVVLMKLSSGSAHLGVAALRGCDVSAIVEQRRDIHRYPFRAAIQYHGPLAIDDRHFLSSAAADDSATSPTIQFMVPLVMMSEVIGVMVIEMDREAIQRWGDFESCLGRYANDMAIFLAGNRNNESDVCDETELMRQSSRALPEQVMAASLIKDEIQYRSFGKMLDSTINGAETAIAICDVFGQLVKLNEKMITLLQREDVSSQESTCVEVLSQLTKRDEAECRKLFRRCIVEDRSEQIVLASKSADEPCSVLFIRPLSRPELSEQRGIESRFVSIEIVSAEIFDAINHWQRQFLAAQSVRIDRQMDLLLQIAGDLEIVKRDGGPATDPYVAMARDVLRSVNECRAAVGHNLTDSPTDHFLLDTKPILAAALKSSQDDLTQYGVVVHQELPVEELMASGNPFLLEQVFITIIDCLITDCDEETQLVIGCDQTSETLQLQFSTQSTQIETTELERCLFGATESDRVLLTPSEDALVTQQHLDRLREANRWLSAWGAKLTIQCDAFYRVSISITLLNSDTVKPRPVDHDKLSVQPIAAI